MVHNTFVRSTARARPECICFLLCSPNFYFLFQHVFCVDFNHNPLSVCIVDGAKLSCESNSIKIISMKSIPSRLQNPNPLLIRLMKSWTIHGFGWGQRLVLSHHLQLLNYFACFPAIFLYICDLMFSWSWPLSCQMSIGKCKNIKIQANFMQVIKVHASKKSFDTNRAKITHTTW